MTTVNPSASGSTFSPAFLDSINGTSGSSGTSGTSSTGSSAASAAAGSAGALQNQFLTLLVAQMNNQDPLNPMDNSEVTSQLAQISTVSGISQLNNTLQSVTSQVNASQSLQAASMIGHGVLVPGNKIGVTGGVATPFGFSLAQAADKVTVSIVDANGKTIRTINEGAASAGVQPLAWDGKTDTGAVAADGNYTATITASANGQSVTINPLTYGVVNSVVQDPTNGVSLDLGPAGTAALSSVAQILPNVASGSSSGTTSI